MYTQKGRATSSFNLSYGPARVTVASGENGLWVVWYNSCVVKVKAQGREIRIGRIQICVRVIGKGPSGPFPQCLL